MNKYLTKNSTENILSWKSKGIGDGKLKPLFNSNIPQLKNQYSHMEINFKRSCIVNENNSISKKKVLNKYIVYHLDNSSSFFHQKFKKLFRSVNITKSHSDFNGQILSGYGIGFYTDYKFKQQNNNSFAYNAVIFGVDAENDDKG